MNTDFTINKNLLGDSIWPEPALSALGGQRSRPVRLHVVDPAIRPLFQHNPWIVLTDEPGGHTIDCSRAWHWAINHSAYFGAGCYEQVGADLRPDSRVEFKLHGSMVHPNNTILICPFSASCSSHQCMPPNKTMPPEWWNDVVGKLGDRLVSGGILPANDRVIASLGAKGEPDIAGTVNHRGHSLRIAAEMILACKVLLCVETFGCVVAGGKTIGSTLVLNSATPISLHVSKEMASRGVKVIREPLVWNWDIPAIVDAVASMADEQ